MPRAGRLCLSLLGVLLAILVHGQQLDQRGLAVTEDGLSRALVTFGVSRALNGVISVVQGTEVAVEPVGIGMTFTPGQILDPVNDLVERFSTVVLVAGTAFGVQRVALEASATPVFSWLTSLLLLVAVAALWIPKRARWACSGRLTKWLVKLALMALVVRFAIPILAVSGELFYQTFLQPQFETSSAQLQNTSQQLGELQAVAEQESGTQSQNQDGTEEEATSFLDKARSLYRSATASLDVRAYINQFKQAAETISEHAIRLMVVFVFQTILLPLVSVWLMLKALRAIMLA